jgi:hypothetical protein
MERKSVQFEDSTLISKINKECLKPNWFYFYLLIPVFFIALAYLQTFSFSIERMNLDSLLNKSYITVVFSKKWFPFILLLLTLILYLPFISSIMLLTKGQGRPLDSRRLKSHFKKVMKERLIESLIILCAVLFSYFLIKGEFDWKGNLFVIVFWIIGYFIFPILFSRFVAGTTASISKIVFIFPISFFVLLLVLWVTSMNTPLDMMFIIKDGMWKDLFTIGFIYFLMVTFTIWVVTKYSLTKVQQKNKSYRQKLITEPTQYGIPVSLLITFVILAFIIMFFEIQYIGSPLFVERASILYKTQLISKNFKIEDIIAQLRNIQDDHFIWRSVYCLTFGTIFTVSLGVLVKIGAYYAFIKSSTVSSQINEKNDKKNN